MFVHNAIPAALSEIELAEAKIHPTTIYEGTEGEEGYSSTHSHPRH